MVVTTGFCPKCRRTLGDGEKFCAHCGWRNPEMIAKGKRLRLEGCFMMLAALLACGGGCTAMGASLIPGDIFALFLLAGVALSIVGAVKWWIGLGFYDGK